MPEDIEFDPTNKGTLWPNEDLGSTSQEGGRIQAYGIA